MKAKAQALDYERKYLVKIPNAVFTRDSIQKLEALNDFPTIYTDLRYVDVVSKSKLLKAYLSDLYPDHIFTVKTERYSGGSNIQVKYTGTKLNPKELRDIENIYQDSGKTDTQSDYFDYDNYCDISEDHNQRTLRLSKCPKCFNCNTQSDRIAITSNDDIICEVCFNSGKWNSFKQLVHEVMI
jgi:hypothetical protein